MDEIQQLSWYTMYVKRLGWTVISVDGVFIFLKKIPIYGVLAKIQRPQNLPYLPKLIPILKKNQVRTVALEPTSETDAQIYTAYLNSLRKFFHLNTSPFLQTKTILVDLTASEDILFSRLTEAKRRAIRRAINLGVTIVHTHSITELISIKNSSAGLFGEITTWGVKELTQVAKAKNYEILLAKKDGKTVGGILLLFSGTTAFYWIAGATKIGKKAFAPTLLVWNALLTAKKHGSSHLDFVGVFDERRPKQNTAWLGFTKFKEGFGGKEVYYPI